MITGGVLSVVLVGAAIGAIDGATGTTVSTVLTDDWGNFGNSFLIGTASGAISGAVGVTGLGIDFQIGINAAIGMANYAATTAMSGGKITVGGLVSSFVFGGIAGAVGGSGMMKGGTGLANQFIASGGKNFLGYMAANIGREVVGTLIRESINAIVVGGAIDGLYSRFFSSRLNPNGYFWGMVRCLMKEDV